MKFLGRFCLLAFCFVSVGPRILCGATDAVVTHKATLRSDPSPQHRPILILQLGEDVELVDSTPTHNYYHVRTTEGTEGWVYGRNLEVVAAPTTGGVGSGAGPAGTSHPASAPAALSPLANGSGFSVNWDKPAPAPTTFDGPDGECGPTGDGGDTFTNLRKNRTDVPQSYHEVSWKALQSLPYPVAGRSLAQWTPQQIAAIQPYEGVPVSVTGYLIKIKVEDTGSGESTNCHFVNSEEVDWHVPLVEHPGDGEDTAVVVETTPRIRKSHPKWTPTQLAPWIGAQAPVRISGWTLLDPEHRAHLGKFRSTLWEIHPITKIEVFRNGEWTDLDDLQ